MKSKVDPVIVFASVVFAATIIVQILAYNVFVVGGFNQVAKMATEDSGPAGNFKGRIYENVAGYAGFYVTFAGGALVLSIAAFAVVLIRKRKAPAVEAS